MSKHNLSSSAQKAHRSLLRPTKSSSRDSAVSLKEVISNPGHSLWKVSLPVIAVGVLETLYYVIDTIFIGALGPDALAGVTFAGPLFFILLALSIGVNSGITSIIARKIGNKQILIAGRAAVTGIVLSALLSIVITFILLFGGKQLLMINGADGSILDYAWDYSWILVAGSILMFISYACNAIFIAQGDSKTAMIIDGISLLANIALTPLFLFVFHTGVGGVALATNISLLIGCILSWHYLKTRSRLKIVFFPGLLSKKWTIQWKEALEIMRIGFPATITLGIIAVYTFFLNAIFIHFSPAHVAAWGIVSKIESICILPMYGLSVGAMTIVGMLYGAKKYTQLQYTIWYAIKIGVIVSLIFGAIFALFSLPLLHLFSRDLTILKIAVPLLLIDIFTFPTMAIVMIVGRIMQGLGKGMPGLLLQLIKIFLIIIPLGYVCVYVFSWGFLSVGFVMIVGGIISGILAIVWQYNELRLLQNSISHPEPKKDTLQKM